MRRKRKFLLGFSMVETIIIIAALAIAVAAATPIITRKLINNSDIGSTLGGGTHGRYEIYAKEVLSFGPDRTPQNTDPSDNASNYKKTNPSQVKNAITVYEKKDESFYKKITGSSPVTGAGKTSTLYEEITGVTPVKDASGKITSATKTVNGAVQTYVPGVKYIFEDANAQYVSNAGSALDKSKNRIIEGNLTTKYPKTSPSTNNTLWQLTVKKESDVSGGVTGYEKVTDSKIKGDLIVYERKDDSEYKTLTGSAPVTSGSNKSILYEEITNATPIKDKDGIITQAKIKIDGKETVIKNDSKYIFENPQVTYVKGVLKVVNGITTFIPDEKGKTIDKSKNRIIEGNYTAKYNKNNPKTNNVLWHIQANSGNYNGDVTVIPWERVVSGSKEIVDRPISPDSDGNYVGKFTPPATAVDTVIHACGGGGAGGGPGADSLDAFANPKVADSDEIRIMKKQLAKRFREHAKKKGHDFSGVSDDVIVTVVNDPYLSTKNWPDFINNDNTYIVLNKANGTITVKMDVRNGLIFPNDLLDYTKILGSQTQTAEIHDMPTWFNWQNITDGRFRAGAVACGGAGGKAGNLVWDTTGSTPDTDTLVGKYGMCDSWMPPICPNEGQCDEHCYISAVTCRPNSNPSVYFSCANKKYTIDGSCDYSPRCECNRSVKGDRTSVTYRHTYYGGSGGAAPQCVWLGSLVKEPVSVSSACLEKAGYDGGNGHDYYTNQKIWIEPISVPKINGENGLTCSATVNGITSYSVGGTGGLACIQNQAEFDKEDPHGPLDSITSRYVEEATKACEAMPGCTITNSLKTMKYVLDKTWMRKALPDAHCPNGSPGKATEGKVTNEQCYYSDGSHVNCMSHGTGKPDTGNFGGDGYGIGHTTGEYNYIYTWTIPYGTNYLGYGEAGSAGDYSSTKIPKVEGTLCIKLGKGGVWTNDKWKQGAKGPNGTDTVVSMGESCISAKDILVAKGGQGGRGNLKTNNYELCFANDRDKKCSDNPNVSCCSGIPKDSKEISSTTARPSIFDSIKSFAGNSTIVGIGLCRGAEGAGTESGEFELYGPRTAVDATADSSFNNKTEDRTVYIKDDPSSSKGSPEVATCPDLPDVSRGDYKNTYMEPAQVNGKGGDGGVIITW